MDFGRVTDNELNNVDFVYLSYRSWIESNYSNDLGDLSFHQSRNIKLFHFHKGLHHALCFFRIAHEFA